MTWHIVRVCADCVQGCPYYIYFHIFKALSDKVTGENFQLILEELEKYKVLKEEVRTKTKKKILTENEESLIERDGKKRVSPFGGWLKRSERSGLS